MEIFFHGLYFYLINVDLYQHMTTAKVKVFIVEEHSIVGGGGNELILALYKNNKFVEK